MTHIQREQEAMVRSFCDEVYTELAEMRMKVLTMMDELSVNYGESEPPYDTYKRHLQDLAEQIDWKLQILSHACPYDWKGSRERIESTVSVPQSAGDFSGGYLGG